MSDLVDDLRDQAKVMLWIDHRPFYMTICVEAADRIDELEAENKRLRERLKEALICALDADPIRYGFLHKHLQDLEEDSNDDVKERP